MTDRIAWTIVIAVVAFFLADLVLFDWGLTLPLARRLAALVEYLAFWR